MIFLAVIEHDFKIGFRDINNFSFLSIKGLLGFLEEAGGIHSDLAGYGYNDIEKTKSTWILLAWKAHILKHSKYSEVLTVKTWARSTSKFHTCRDFEVFDVHNELVAIASSKWVFVNTETGKIQRISDDVLAQYAPEEKHVFDIDMEKLVEPSKYIHEYNYNVRRCDIDANNHMHNLYYIDLAFETLPQEVYLSNTFSDIEVMYKKSALLGEELKCLYSFENDTHVVTIKSNDEKDLHAIIHLK